MMTQTTFKRLSLNNKFVYKNVQYTKIRAIMKNCCEEEYNAEDIYGTKILIPKDALVEVMP